MKTETKHTAVVRRPKLPKALEWACVFYSARIYDATHRKRDGDPWSFSQGFRDGELHGFRTIIYQTLRDCPRLRKATGAFLRHRLQAWRDYQKERIAA